MSDEILPAEIVYDLAGILKLADKAFIVGGQALNLWAERYSHVAELMAYSPYTSKDLDYFGHREAAQKLADAIGGTVLVPRGDDHTPQTAIVKAVMAGRPIEVDFLWHIKGVEEASLVKQAVEVIMKVRLEQHIGELRVPIMHPLHCLQSRLSNVVELGRDTDLAKRQLEASPIVLRAYLDEVLENGMHRHVTGVLQALTDYLLEHQSGRRAHKVMGNDPADVLAAFAGDARLDSRWRELSLASMMRTVSERRKAWDAMPSLR